MLKLDTGNREPIYTQIEKQIIKLINLGVYEPDDILPSVRAVACELGINPNTVAKAYRNLEQMGVIYTITGKGAFVSASNLEKIRDMAKTALKAALADAKNAGLEKKDIIETANELWRDGK